MPSTAGVIALHPLGGIDEVSAGTDLPALLADALATAGLLPCVAGDVLVVTQKIVSKAEGRFADFAQVVPDAEADRIAGATGKDPRLVALVLQEASDIVRAAPNVLIARNRHGQVMANAGIDRSNLGGDAGDTRVLLLPEDPDASAGAIRRGLAAALDSVPAVIISDSFGRPWRYGVVNVAIGAAGLPALVDRRGEPDRDGRPLEVTQVALGDMLATAAGLAMGEGAEGVPAVLVRGLALPTGDSPATALVRSPAEDLFR